MAVKAADEREERKESVVLLSISSHSNHHQPQIVASSINIKQKLNEPGNVDDVDFSPASKSTAPDGGWRAWMVCVASFYCNGAMFGVMNSAGVIYVKLQEHFPTEKDDSFRLCE